MELRHNWPLAMMVNMFQASNTGPSHGKTLSAFYRRTATPPGDVSINHNIGRMAAWGLRVKDGNAMLAVTPDVVG
jgi:hypothetical protein